MRTAILPAEELSERWAALHSGERFTISTNEVHYLKMLALALDDDVASLLLLKKIRLSRMRSPVELPSGVAVMNSFVAWSFDGEQREGRLGHPSGRQDADAVSVASRIGAGLVGLSAGQAIVWPDRHDRLRELRVIGVEPPATAPREQIEARTFASVQQRSAPAFRP